MRVSRIKIQNFRGIKSAEILLPDHVILVGDNNTGKSTLLEAIDLVLGPDRVSRQSVIDEHDFYAGEYLGGPDRRIAIHIELVVISLSDEQARYFQNNIEWWNCSTNRLVDGPPPEGIEDESVVPALRLGFEGEYDPDEDDFTAQTFFCSPERDDGTRTPFKKADKQKCGFLYLRTLRTGSRALSLERGSLLDIILRLKETRVQMWEQVLTQLRDVSVAEDNALGLTETLSSVQEAIRSFVPYDWGSNPQMKVSQLTRESLRDCLSIFMSTGATNSRGDEYSAPFQHQGTGTINTLVLSMLSMIAELKQNVIFAMEEPEIAIPPHTQKRIINSIRSKSAQSLFTSHSPYVMEESNPEQILVLHNAGGVLSAIPARFPEKTKPKLYRTEFRKRYCEALLARRVLIVEGETEFQAITSAARRLNEIDPVTFKTVEELGITVFNAESDSQIAPMALHFRNFEKQIYAIFDRQEIAEQLRQINESVDHAFQSDEKSFEKLLLDHTSENGLRRFAKQVVDEQLWPQHLSSKTPADGMPLENLKDALHAYFSWGKGAGTGGDLLSSCDVGDMPKFIVSTVLKLKEIVEAERANLTVDGVTQEGLDGAQ